MEEIVTIDNSNNPFLKIKVVPIESRILTACNRTDIRYDIKNNLDLISMKLKELNDNYEIDNCEYSILMEYINNIYEKLR